MDNQEKSNPSLLPQKIAREYLSPRYLNPERLSSIGWQFGLVMSSNGKKVLNIGVGSGLLESLLMRNEVEVTTMDLDLHLEPSVVGNILQIPFTAQSFDTVMAFQILEHLPYHFLGQCLSELSRVSRKQVIISLPDRSLIRWEQSTKLTYSSIWLLRIDLFELLGLKERDKFEIDKEHHWEIGIQGIRYKDIIKLAKSMALETITHFRNPYFPYHHFFVFEQATDINKPAHAAL